MLFVDLPNFFFALFCIESPDNMVQIDKGKLLNILQSFRCSFHCFKMPSEDFGQPWQFRHVCCVAFLMHLRATLNRF